MSNPMIDALDRRVLLAAFATLNARGTLSVAGGAAADQIVVDRSASQIRARLNGQTLNFPAAAVKRIWANGFGGNDAIENRTTLPSTLIGEGGRDTLVGGSNNDSLDGGSGVDTLRSGRGADTLSLGIEGDLIDYSDEPAGGFGAGDDDYGLTDFSISTPSGQSDLVQQPARNLRFLASPGNDRIRTERNNSLLWIDGGGGNDDILGGARPTQPGDPSPTLAGGGGNDTIGASEDLVTDALLGGSGNDTIYDELGYRFVDAGSGYDKLFLARSIAPDYQIGPGVEYFEKTEEGTGVVFGNELNNRIIITGGATAIHGGGGDDHISVTSGSPTNTSIFGESGNDTLAGGDGNDSLDGGGGDDVLRDSIGTNYFTGGAGADQILPGDGKATGDLDTADTLDYAGATPGYFEFDCNEYRVQVRRERNGPVVGDFLFQNIGSPIQIFATSGADNILSRSYYTNADIHGAGGNDRIEAYRQNFESVARAFGDGGNDTIMTYGEDIITDNAFGGSGDDLFIRESAYGVASQSFDGGPGFDRLEVGFVGFVYSFAVTIPNGVEALRSGPGLNSDPDTFLQVYGNDLANRIEVSANFTTIYGAGGNDTIIAGDGIDHIEGNAGNDSIIGNAGDDRIFGGSGNDTLVGGAGRDLLHGQAGDDFISSRDSEIDTIDGGAGIDRADRDPPLDLVSEVEIFD